jgi:hypothetical protein
MSTSNSSEYEREPFCNDQTHQLLLAGARSEPAALGNAAYFHDLRERILTTRLQRTN